MKNYKSIIFEKLNELNGEFTSDEFFEVNKQLSKMLKKEEYKDFMRYESLHDDLQMYSVCEDDSLFDFGGLEFNSFTQAKKFYSELLNNYNRMNLEPIDKKVISLYKGIEKIYSIKVEDYSRFKVESELEKIKE